jgi:hypothetical protein
MKIRLGIALVFCALIMHAARAESLRLATDENLPPYSFSRDGVAVGIDVDMLRAAAAQLQREITVVTLPWKRVLHHVENGDMPLSMPLFKTPERDEKHPAYLVISKAARFNNKDQTIASLTLILDKLHCDGTCDRIVKNYSR